MSEFGPGYPNGRSLLALAAMPGSSSFHEFVRSAAPHLLPHTSSPLTPSHSALSHSSASGSGDMAPHGTTIVAAVYADGVVLAGDRRATMGNLIAQRDIEKVFPADEFSLIGIAGTAGIAIEIVRLFQVELEHYEKIEGTPLTLDGKANRLSTMIRGNLGAAMQGLAVVPLFAGYDVDGSGGEPARIYSYDVTGGRYPERYYHSIGSGSVFAKSALKKLWRPDLTRAEVVRVVVEALYDAADDDSATGGPDVRRQIYPIVRLATADGVSRVDDAELAVTVDALIADRADRPGS